MYTHYIHLLTLGFYISKSIKSSCEKPLALACNVMTTPTSVDRKTLMFTEKVFCDVTNFAPFQSLRHVGADKHDLFWSILTKVVPGLIWMVANMTVYKPANFLYNLLIKISKYVIRTGFNQTEVYWWMDIAKLDEFELEESWYFFFYFCRYMYVFKQWVVENQIFYRELQ